MPETKKYKVLFYTSVSRLFRTTLIGNLYEISQVHPTVLLSEELDKETIEIIEDKKMFPNVKEIIKIDPPLNGKLIKRNRKMKKAIKDAVFSYRPDIIISSNDMNPVGLYLMRYGKKIGAVNIAIQAGLSGKSKDLALFYNLNSAYVKMPQFLPFSLRLFFAKFKKILGHFLYYWVLPITAGEMPFLGKSSFVKLEGAPGMRDGDYYVVFSKKDYDICINDGVTPEKLYILPHPLARNIMSKFLKINSAPLAQEENKKILTFMYSAEEVGFERNSYKFISKEDLLQSRVKMVSLIYKILKDWKIFIKPHPSVSEVPELLQKITETFEPISKQIKVVNPSEPADKYIEMSNVIVGIPPASTTLFTACLQCPEKIIISADLKREFLGDVYENFRGIDYLDNEEDFTNALEAIKNNKYSKINNFKLQKESNEFSNTIEMMDYLFNKKNHV